jgi:hypothetical protein
VMTNLMGKYGSISAWYIPKGFANIFSMHKLEKKHRITHNSWQGYYQVHTASRVVKFFKDKRGLPHINLDGSGQEAAIMLLEETAVGVLEAEKIKQRLINAQTVQENYEG